MDSPNKIQKYKNTKGQKKYKSTHNSAIFWATDSRFCMEIYMDCRTKWQSTKVQKVQKLKNTKLQNRKVQKLKTSRSKKNSPALAISTKKPNRVKQKSTKKE